MPLPACSECACNQTWMIMREEDKLRLTYRTKTARISGDHNWQAVTLTPIISFVKSALCACQDSLEMSSPRKSRSYSRSPQFLIKSNKSLDRGRNTFLLRITHGEDTTFNHQHTSQALPVWDHQRSFLKNLDITRIKLSKWIFVVLSVIIVSTAWLRYANHSVKRGKKLWIKGQCGILMSKTKEF